ncbi:YfiR family protein [Microbulbifer sp. YPW1]|uniref:YfiR family protein n=1 Tax=Microbulbifer sp. YPW1 TaxID=2745199 RepID=UPI002106B323|nr:YfiR family protein [Microbulbifer sp. YPW1]
MLKSIFTSIPCPKVRSRGKWRRRHRPSSGTILRAAARLLLTLCVLLSPSLRAEASGHLSDTDLGRKVMVDYIVHFAHHLQWPIEVFSGAGAPFRICVMGDDELVAPLTARLHRHRVQGRMVALERVNDGEMLRARSCQIVVMGDMDAERMAKAVGALEFFPVLTVSDVNRFAILGGMVEFAGSGADMALQLNKTRLDRAELKMGNSLFRLSRQVN